MAILFNELITDGFLCVDTTSNRTAFAPADSRYAVRSFREPEATAREMLAGENAALTRTAKQRKEDLQRYEALRTHPHTVVAW